MPGAVRKGDICSGHGSCVPRVNDEGSTDVFINGIGAHRLGDHWTEHPGGSKCHHDGYLSEGSPNVFVNGLALGRICDDISCGSTCAEGSGDVIINGN